MTRIIQKIHDSYISGKYVFDSYFPANLVAASEPIILDTSVASENAGDNIIMHFASMQLNEIWDVESLNRIPTHSCEFDFSDDIEGVKKILCGTNAISTHFARNHSIQLPSKPNLYSNSVILLGAGLSGLNKKRKIDFASSRIYHDILNDDYIHSVRDSHTVNALNAIGIENVINTACVTMWKLTPDFCKTIPTVKKDEVLTTITDYGTDRTLDEYMLQTLGAHYKKVYLWIQSPRDLYALRQMSNLPPIELIHEGLPGLQRFVDDNWQNLDYFGTRLHCGIYCLNHHIRSMIVSIDNRAMDIARDTNLPIVLRSDLPKRMEDLIKSDRKTEIQLPHAAIAAWKSQFNKESK